MKIKADYANAPQWKELTIKSRLPEQLQCLDELAHNMWWAWNYEARDLFKDFENPTPSVAFMRGIGHIVFYKHYNNQKPPIINLKIHNTSDDILK